MPERSSNEVEAAIWGASCNSKDKIFSGRAADFEMYDWLVFRNFGAYTTTVSTTFNGFTVGETLLG
jgi:diaminopimelate decarboxylase